MVMHSLTDYTHTTWGAKYSSFNWRPEWYVFIRMQNRELNTMPFHVHKPVAHIIYFFDTNILQRFGKDSEATLQVRIRIVCGLINKIPHTVMSRPMKLAFMECIWDAYKKFKAEWYEYYYRYILELPFQVILV